MLLYFYIIYYIVKKIGTYLPNETQYVYDVCMEYLDKIIRTLLLIKTSKLHQGFMRNYYQNLKVSRKKNIILFQHGVINVLWIISLITLTIFTLSAIRRSRIAYLRGISNT